MLQQISNINNNISSYNLDILVSAFAKERKILQLNVSLEQQLDFKYDVTIKTVLKTNSSNNCFEVHHCSAHDIPAVNIIQI